MRIVDLIAHKKGMRGGALFYAKHPHVTSFDRPFSSAVAIVPIESEFN